MESHYYYITMSLMNEDYTNIDEIIRVHDIKFTFHEFICSYRFIGDGKKPKFLKCYNDLMHRYLSESEIYEGLELLFKNLIDINISDIDKPDYIFDENFKLIINLNLYKYFPDFVFTDIEYIKLIIIKIARNYGYYHYERSIEYKNLIIDIFNRISDRIYDLINIDIKVAYDIFKPIGLYNYEIFDTLIDRISKDSLNDVIMEICLKDYVNLLNHINYNLKFDNSIVVIYIMKKTSDMAFWEEKFDKIKLEIKKKRKEFLIEGYKELKDKMNEINSDILKIEQELESFDF